MKILEWLDYSLQQMCKSVVLNCLSPICCNLWECLSHLSIYMYTHIGKAPQVNSWKVVHMGLSRIELNYSQNE